MRGNLTCSFPGCERHPSRGDTIIRISAKPGPFVGRCSEHYGPDAAEAERERIRARTEHDLKAAQRLADEHPENEFGVGFACGFRAALSVIDKEGGTVGSGNQEEQ